MDNFIDIIKKDRNIKYDEYISLKDYSTYKVGGKARLIVFPLNVESLIKVIKLLRTFEIKYLLIGKASNLIFPDEDFDGVIINLKEFDKIKFLSKNIVKAEAGVSLQRFAMECAKKDLTGAEFMAAIPGTIGGAVYMNAGAYKSDMGYIVSRIKVLTPNLEYITMSNSELDFHYRSSFLQKNPGYIVIEATIQLKKGNEKDIIELIKDRNKRRWETQPLDFPSAGSVFRNPEEEPAGKIIDDLGLKGYKIGGAKVSEKHANFIINFDNAKSSDIINLINHIKKLVKEEKNIDLVCEQKIISWDNL